MDIAQRHERVTALFLQAREMPIANQEQWLRDRCTTDPDLRTEVLAMLAAERNDPSFLESVSGVTPRDVDGSGFDGEAVAPVSADPEGQPAASLPKRIANYTILRKLGEGGAAYVYLAQQESPHREVALKVVKPGVSSRSSFRRLEFEASVLGRMQHPGIAQIFESGLAEVGAGPQPYFAMEFVVGELLTDYARSRDLGVRDRLRLIAKVADAVEHAHQKGIIHRDLKPSNILVNSAGNPKVLDFGIARATDADLYATTLQTDIGQLLGTVPYMSPEQTLGDPDQIDTRSDVYGLGVVAYELLTGRLPYDLSRKGIPEAVRIIRDEDPQHPSAASTSLRGDVETILLKALQKDPDRRYQSVAELATDVQRHLDDEPILARPASATYQLRKFARRHRPLVGACIVGVLALSAAAVIAMLQAHAARQAERMAAAQSKFLSDVLTQASPETQVNHDIRLVDVLQQATEALEGKFQDQPLAKASLYGTLGYTYLTLRDFPAAEKHLKAQRKLLTDLVAPNDPRLVENAHYLARALIERGRPNDAAPFLDDSIAYLRASQGADSLNTLGMMLTKARYYMQINDTEHAKQLLRQILAAVRRVRHEDHPLALICKAELANLHAKNGEFAEAERYLTEVLAGRRRVLGPDQKDTLTSMNNLANLYMTMKRYDDAKPLLIEALPGLRRIWGPDHEQALYCQMNLVKTYVALREYDEAEPLCRDALSRATASLGPDHILARHAQIILTQLEQRHAN